MSIPVCQMTKRGSILASTPDFSLGLIPETTSKLIDCAITINSWIWQTRKVSHHDVSPTSWWESPLLWKLKGETNVRWVFSQPLSRQVHEQRRLVLDYAHRRYWSYIHKMLDGDTFCNWGIVMPQVWIYRYETWHKLSISNMLNLSWSKPSQRDAYGLEWEVKQYGRLILTKILGQTDGVVHQQIGTKQQKQPRT